MAVTLASLATLAPLPLAAQAVTGAPRAPRSAETASETDGTLTLDRVLRASAARAPEILAAIARERQADGRLLSSQGEFDLVFGGKAFQRVLGYYDGSYAEGSASQPLLNNGGQLYGGFRVSRGDFPTYEDRYFTNKLGEVAIGGVFSLLRDRLTDKRRTGLTLARNDVEIAALEREMVAIGVQQRAIDAYLTWVSAGQRLQVYRELLGLATARQAGIERQIQLGGQPALLAVENRQNIVQRRVLVVRAEQMLAVAANDLSFFWRDENGRPIVPDASQLPADLPVIANPLIRLKRIDRVERPDLAAILVRVDKARAQGLLARNDMRPRLDLNGEMAKDLGSEGLGGPSRTPFETKVGVTFSMPLQRRAAKGRAAEADARIDELTRDHMRLEDRIVVEINRLAVRANASESQIDLAEQDIDLAGRLADGERRRLFLGASDLLTVNLREQAVVQARINLLDARYQLAALRGELAAVTADRRQLELD